MAKTTVWTKSFVQKKKNAVCSKYYMLREILFDFVAATINIQPTNEMFLRIMTSRDITVVKSLAQFIYGCFKQNNC